MGTTRNRREQLNSRELLFYLFYVLFNDAVNTFLINCYVGVGNILIGKIPSGYLTGIDLRSTACQKGAYINRLFHDNITINFKNMFSASLAHTVYAGAGPSWEQFRSA